MMPLHALGLDAGGSQTRWLLVSASDQVVASGSAAGFSGMQMNDEAGRAAVDACLACIARDVSEQAPDCSVTAVVAGVTGVGAGSPPLVALIAERFAVEAARVNVVADVEIAYRAAFAPGDGYLVYAGTGSIAAFIDAGGVLRRAGGRGVHLDDAGGGYWIAREALRRVWRREDERPGVWHDSPMAVALFNAVGGDSSVNAARFLMERTRGEIGRLALHVVNAAERDALATEILKDAGTELARLANAMQLRYGARPVVVNGRAALMHPLIECGLRAHVSSDTDVTFRAIDSTRAAARMAIAMLRAGA
jgi:glucosamine kinase